MKRDHRTAYECPLTVGEWVRCAVFADLRAGGNPMVVARLSAWPTHDVLFSLASTLPSAEVTFLCCDEPGETRIRWFGPRGELPNCGHGSLAASAVMRFGLHDSARQAVAGPKSMPLTLTHSHGVPTIGMAPATLDEMPTSLIDIGLPVARLFDAGRDYLAIVADEQALRAYRPDRERLERTGKLGLILSAPCANGAAAFRFFAPRAGIFEDRASASVVPALVRHWFGDAQTEGVFVQCSGRDVPIMARVEHDEVRVSGPVMELARGRFDLTKNVEPTLRM